MIDNIIECQICHKKMKKVSLKNHVFSAHKIKIKDYYDKYLKKDDEGICYCGNQTKFLSFLFGYREFCSVNCQTKSKEITKPLKILFEKNYECMICNKKLTTINGLSKHIRLIHNMTSIIYYDKYLKKDNEGLCQYCGKKTKFLGLNKGYNSYCCNSCGSLDPFIQDKNRETNLKKYGETNFSKTRRGRLISRNTCIHRIQIQKECGYSTVPAMGKYESSCLNELQKYTDFEIKRNPKIIGYFPDGYIKELKLIIEFDESVHYVNNKLTKKDQYRQNELEKYLKCNFYRIKESDWLKDPNTILEKFREVIK